MFSRILSDKVRVALSIPEFGEELFALTDLNREFLKVWLPWLDHVTKPEDSEKFLAEQRQRFALGEALHLSIFFEDALAGVLGFNQIDRANKIGYIGYWLGEAYNGKGIMTLAVRDLMAIGQEYYRLEKFDIRAATANAKSRSIPERLGYKHEGTIRHAEKVYDRIYDHEVYGFVVGKDELTT